jgi:formylmethanofuran dehydrogenase subunit D
MEADIEIVTIRDIFQDQAQKRGRYTDEYRKLSAQIILDREDMEKLGAKEGDRVKVENEVGSVVVAAKLSTEVAHPGVAFMANSPWANQLVPDQVSDTSIPDFKRITARVLPSSEELTKIEDLLQRMKAEGTT